jgi:hypothetical protein
MKNNMKIITNLRTLLVSIGLLLLGCIFLFLSEQLSFGSGYFWLKSLISNFGGLLVATLSIAILWELFSKRSFLEEILERTGLADDVRTVGLRGISVNPAKGPDFAKLIRDAERLDIFVCYANTWRANHEADLKYLASKRKARIRLILPDPDNAEIMRDLAKRFGATSDQVIAQRIKDAIQDYKDLFLSVGNPDLDFSIWLHCENPVTSFYRFDRCAVVTLYKHARGRGNVPTLVVERYGTLYNYVEAEIDALIKGDHEKQALARQVYPPIISDAQTDKAAKP